MIYIEKKLSSLQLKTLSLSPFPSVASISMEAFNFSSIKAEKENTMPRYNVFSAIAKTLRILELCLLLLFLSWILTRLPFALRLSADCLRKLSTFLRSPLFVFALSNAIIAALVAQSGRFTTASDGDTSPSETYSDAPLAEEVESQEEHILDTCTNEDSGSLTDSGSRKVYRRSLSETVKGNREDGNETEKRKLWRSETEKVRENLYPHDKLSNEEFQRTIEAFIAKQIRFLREES